MKGKNLERYLFLAVFFYIIGAFIYGGFNPAVWRSGGKIFIAFLFVVGCFFTLIASHSDDD